jgi:hypothetical protein
MREISNPRIFFSNYFLCNVNYYPAKIFLFSSFSEKKNWPEKITLPKSEFTLQLKEVRFFSKNTKLFPLVVQNNSIISQKICKKSLIK